MNDGRQNPVMNCYDAMTAHGFPRLPRVSFRSWSVGRLTGKQVGGLPCWLVGWLVQALEVARVTKGYELNLTWKTPRPWRLPKRGHRPHRITRKVAAAGQGRDIWASQAGPVQDKVNRGGLLHT